jgi:hypothetical protein
MLRCGSATLCEVEAMCDGCEVEVQVRDWTRRVAMRCEVWGRDRMRRIVMCGARYEFEREQDSMRWVAMWHEVRGRDRTRWERGEVRCDVRYGVKIERVTMWCEVRGQDRTSRTRSRDLAHSLWTKYDGWKLFLFWNWSMYRVFILNISTKYGQVNKNVQEQKEYYLSTKVATCDAWCEVVRGRLVNIKWNFKWNHARGA